MTMAATMTATVTRAAGITMACRRHHGCRGGAAWSASSAVVWSLSPVSGVGDGGSVLRVASVAVGSVSVAGWVVLTGPGPGGSATTVLASVSGAALPFNEVIIRSTSA